MTANTTYFYGQEADAFTFFRVPKLLFSPTYKGKLSTESKLLYGLMLDRMGLSATHKGWQDPDGRIYIYFPREEVAELLDITERSATKLYKELENVGLIERVEQGMGKPRKIYVHKYFNPDTLSIIGVDLHANDADAEKETETAPEAAQEADGQKFPHSGENISSHQGKNFPPDGKNLPRNLNTENNKTYSTKNQSINQAANGGASAPEPTPTVAESKTDEYRRIFKQNLYYEELIKPQSEFEWEYFDRKGLVDELINLLADECASEKKLIRVGGQNIPRAEFKKRLLTFDQTATERIIDAFSSREPDHIISNRRAYLLTMIYNHETSNRRDD